MIKFELNYLIKNSSIFLTRFVPPYLGAMFGKVAGEVIYIAVLHTKDKYFSKEKKEE